MKKLPLEQRKLSTTVAMSQLALSKLDIMCENMRASRSSIVESAVGFYFRWYQTYGPDHEDWIDEDPHEITNEEKEIATNEN